MPTSSGVWPFSAAFSAEMSTSDVDSATRDKAKPGDLIGECQFPLGPNAPACPFPYTYFPLSAPLYTSV